MTWDDIIYFILLLTSIIVGPYLRRIKDTRSRQQASALAGFLIVFVASGWHILHPIILIIVNVIITLFLSKRICHTVSFVFCFSYLAFARVCHYFGIPPIPPYVNAVQMILTLKMVGLAFEIHDTHVRKTEKKKDALEAEFLNVDPSILDVFYYGFCHAGVLTGPFYKYRTYWDSFYCNYSKNVDYLPHLINRLKFVPMYVILYLLSGYIFPLEYAESEEIFTRSFWYRVWYVTPLFFNFRMRIYTGFVLSECQCISAGLGVYPSDSKSKPGQGPTELGVLKKINQDKKVTHKLGYDFETVHNVNEYGADFVSTVREGMHNWNMTVQYWLAMFVYKRVPWKNLRVTITMFTSAFWHGIYPGYYVCLLSVPLHLMAEDAMAKAFRRDATPEGQRTYDWICWFFKMQAFAYMGVGFLLLRIDTTLNYYKSIYFIGHLLMVAFYLFGSQVLAMKRKYDKIKISVKSDNNQEKNLKLN